MPLAEPKPEVVLPNASGLFTYKVPLSATVKDVNNGTPFSGIVVHFKVGNIDAGSDTTNSSGVATVQFAVPEALPTGANKLMATADVGSGYVKKQISVISNFDAVKAPTALSFNLPLPASKIVNEGDTLTLSGHLNTNSPDKVGISNGQITFIFNGTEAFSATTDSKGNYSKTWKVPVGFSLTADISAHYEGDSHYLATAASNDVKITFKHSIKLPNNTYTTSGIHIIGVY